MLDIDRDRAREALGVGRADRAAYDKQLRGLMPGEFFAIGRAFGTLDPIRLKIGPVVSTHPEPGQATHRAAPPPPAKIRAILAKLGDIPREAARKLETEADLRAEVTRLAAAIAAQKIGLDPALARERAAAIEERDLLRLELAKFAGATPAEVTRLREMERHFDAVVGAIDGYRNAGGGRYAAVDFSAPAGTRRPPPAPARSAVIAKAAPAPRTARVARTTSETLTKPEGWTMEEEALYQKFVARLKREAPTLLKVMATESELDIEVTIKTVPVDGDTLRGRIAGLIPAGFFDSPKKGIELLRELRRRGGRPGDKNNYSRELNWLAESGFLTIEEDGYLVVPSMKANVRQS